MRRARSWIGVAFSLICMVFALRGIQWVRVWYYLNTADVMPLIAAALLITAGSLARAFRWQLLLYPHRCVTRMRLFAIINIGYLLINILPARVGELARAYLVGRSGQISAAHAFSTIVVERIYDTTFAVLLLAVISPFIPLPPWAVRGGLTVGAATVALAALLFVMAGQQERLLAIWRGTICRVRWLERPGLDEGFRSAVGGLAVLRRREVMLGVLGWSAVVWGCNLGPFYLVIRALNLGLPWSAAGLTVSITALSMVIPSSPGYLGVFEEGVILSLGLLSIDRDTALAYALLIHALIYVVPSFWGLIGLWQESLSLSLLRRELGKRA